MEFGGWAVVSNDNALKSILMQHKIKDFSSGKNVLHDILLHRWLLFDDSSLMSLPVREKCIVILFFSNL